MFNMSTPPTTTTLPTPPQGSTTATTKPSPTSAGSSTPKDSPSKTPSVAATRRAQFAACHGSGTSSPATSFGRGRLPPDRQASLRRRRSSYGRRGSSFDIPHSNSLPCVPVDLKGLEGINEKEGKTGNKKKNKKKIEDISGAGIMAADDRQVTTVFTVQPSFHHRHSTNPVS